MTSYSEVSITGNYTNSDPLSAQYEIQHHKHQTPQRRKIPSHFHSFPNLTVYFHNIYFIGTLFHHFSSVIINQFHRSFYTKILHEFPSHIWSNLVCITTSTTDFRRKQYLQTSLFLGPDISLKLRFQHLILSSLPRFITVPIHVQQLF
jgi:hypothetical protein